MSTSPSPLVTVVIPTYNQARFLREALESVIAQTFTDWEAVVVDNCSEDDTAAVVSSFCDTRIRLEKIRNNGIIAASRNRAIALARGRYLAFLDSDDTWSPTKLTQCVEYLDKGRDLVCHGIRFIGGARERDFYCGPARRATFDSLLNDGNCIVTSATVVRRSLVEAVGKFSEEPELVTAEDYHLWLKLARAGAKIGFIGRVLGCYRYHQGNHSGAVSRHILAVRRVVEGFFAEDTRTGFAMRLRRQRRLGIAYYMAGRNLQDGGQCRDARSWLLRALGCWPFHAKTYVALALSTVCGAFSVSAKKRRGASRVDDPLPF